MLDQAAETAERLGAEGITREVAECRDALAATGSLNEMTSYAPAAELSHSAGSTPDSISPTIGGK